MISLIYSREDVAELLKTLSALRKKQKLYEGEISVYAEKGTFVFKKVNKKRTITLKIKLAKNGKDSFELSIKDDKKKGA